MIHHISIEALMERFAHLPLLDVRSPGEYAHAHIPGAASLPLFSDAERAVIGTAYKQQGREPAVLLGLDFFAPNMKALLNQALTLCKGQKQVVVHCWRGGMRSGAVAWLLELYGLEVFKIEGGYKAYRHWVLERMSAPYKCEIVSGYTGSHKTQLLHHLHAHGEAIIDLEALAQHKGSAFGHIGLPPQPSQEMFENLLASELYRHRHRTLWIEDESQRMGNCTIPNSFWLSMRNASVHFIEYDFEERLHNIVAQYGTLDVTQLMAATTRIAKRFGPLETKTTMALMEEGNIRQAFALLLKYYDKKYLKALNQRAHLDKKLHRLPATGLTPSALIQQLFQQAYGSPTTNP